MNTMPTFIPIRNCRGNGGTSRDVNVTAEELLQYMDACRGSNAADVSASSTGTSTMTLAAASGAGKVIVPALFGRVSLGSTVASNAITWTAAGAKDGSVAGTEVALAPNWSFLVDRPGEEALFLLIPPVLGGSGEYYPNPFTLIYDGSAPVDCVITPSGGVSSMENTVQAVSNGSRYWNDTIAWLEQNRNDIRGARSNGLFA